MGWGGGGVGRSGELGRRLGILGGGGEGWKGGVGWICEEMGREHEEV